MPGRVALSDTTKTREDFTGHERDAATGLHYAGARYYLSAFGWWAATDPILAEKEAEALLEQDRRLRSAYGCTLDPPADAAVWRWSGGVTARPGISADREA